MRAAVCLFLALILAALTVAQNSAPIQAKVSDVLARMKSADLSGRERAFDDMMGLLYEGEHPDTASGPAGPLGKFFARHPDQADPVKLGLIQFLASSNDLFVAGKNATPETYTENNSEHYAQLIDAVASLDDERTIPVLVGAMTTGGIAQRGLLKYGDKALGPVMEELHNQDPVVRSAALGLSITLLNKQNDPASHKRIVDLIRSSLTDPSSVVRSHAVREIGCVADRQEFIPALENIAQTDPQKLPGKALDGGDGGGVYPVRYAARQTLRDIRNNKSCSP